MARSCCAGFAARISLSAFAIVTAFCCAGCSSGSDADVKYVALGASDALGVGADPVSDGYVFQIEGGLEDNGLDTKLINLGIPGAKIDLIKDTALKIATEEDPDLVTLFTGPNDITDGNSPSDFESDLRELLEKLRNETQAFIVIATVPDLTQTPRYQSDPSPNVTAERIAQFNAAILNQAAAFGVSVVDLRSLEVNDDITASDGYHPNGEGYTIVAQEFLKVILPHFAASTTSAQ